MQGRSVPIRRDLISVSEKTQHGHRQTREFTFHYLKDTVLDLITAHNPVSAQPGDSVVFKLQPVYFLSTSLCNNICCRYPFELRGLVDAI